MEREVADIVLFLGRFHPLVVHLPIGFLVFAFLLELVGYFQKKGNYVEAVPLALLAGWVSALVACILGYMLSLGGDYEEALTNTHFWFGVATTGLVFGAWLFRTGRWGLSKLDKLRPNIAILTLVVLLLGITGHYGGNLTHGSDYLVKYAPFGPDDRKELPSIATVGEARVYAYLIDPILQEKCAGCHNSGKKKGGLSYESLRTLMEGGESGPIIVPGNASESEMIRRIRLPQDHEDFMPPEGKTPLTGDEIALLDFWIGEGRADGQVRLDSMEVPVNIMEIASRLLPIGGASSDGNHGFATGPEIDLSHIAILEEMGFQVRELAHDSNLFDVTLPEKGRGRQGVSLDQKLRKLEGIKHNIVWLSLGNNEIRDEHLTILQGFDNLSLLKLDNNPITDEGIATLKDLPKLESLNLYGTRVTKKSLDHFSKLGGLRKVYVWNTGITPQEAEPYMDLEAYPRLIFGI